jgi:cellulose synthase/poly-beta-1,6-N-acetylglucosamine synthase-like glycosyltransferase
MFDWLTNLTTHPDFRSIILWVSLAVVAVGFIQNLIYAWCLPQAWLELNKRSQRDDDHAGWMTLRSASALPISIIVPAYNEANTIRENVMALLSLQYPDLRIIVVNDGSSDRTAQTMVNEFKMVETSLVRDAETITHKPIRQIYRSKIHPSLLFIDKENGKKADAINVGLTCVRTPLFCVIDADSLLEPTALLQAVRPFTETSDNVIAVGGTVGIVNGCKIRNGQVEEYSLPSSFLARLQVVEYIRAFLMARLAASRKGSLAIISGAFGIFRRDIAVAVGGYDTTTVGEDMELVLKMHRHMLENNLPYAVRYVPEPVCWTEAPESFKFLSNQRTRWQRGALECLSRHKKMIFNPRYGRLGLVTLPTFVLIDLISPVAEILGYILMIIFVLMGWMDVKFFIAITCLIFSYGVLISVLSLALEQDEIERFSRVRDIWMVLLIAIAENLGFRQICSFWRIRGLIQHFRGMKPTWGTMERRGFSTSED